MSTLHSNLIFNRKRATQLGGRVVGGVGGVGGEGPGGILIQESCQCRPVLISGYVWSPQHEVI